MIDLSLSGLLGAVVGTVIAALAYRPLVAMFVRYLRVGDAPSAVAGRPWPEEMPLLRRAVLAADLLLLAGIGYWIGASVGG